jgi:hypothetical protein
MYSARIIAGLIYRLFLLSLIVAVLWVKGYLWWIFGIAILLYLIDGFMNLPIGLRRREDDDSDEDDDEDSDIENNGEDKPPF